MADLFSLDNINFRNINKRHIFLFKYINKLIEQETIQNYEIDQIIEKIIEKIGVEILFDQEDLKKIPQKDSFVIISNFPFGGLEGFILYQILKKIRPDLKIVVNTPFYTINKIKDLFIPFSVKKKNFNQSVKKIIKEINNNHPLLIFPATSSSKFLKTQTNAYDVCWNKKLINLIYKLKKTIIPVYFSDSYTKVFYFLTSIHPIFNTLLLKKEIKLLEDKNIEVKIGNPIKFEAYEKFKNIDRLTRFLRAKIYILNIAKSNFTVEKIFKYKANTLLKEPEPIAKPLPQELIIQQVEKAKENYLLFQQKDFEIICAPPQAMPDVITEIGRLREITFRAVGEGTNKSLDLDEFDIYYYHLIIWDNANKKIVGAYRIGLGDQIIERFSIKGFYTSTLFKYSKKMIPILKQSLEMGRSFIVEEYQRKPLSLFLLWKGILYFLLKNPNYRYLIGPVSISQTFSDLSKSIIVQFFQKYHWNKTLAKYVKPRKKYKVKLKFDNKIILDDIGNDIQKLDNYIKEIEKGARLPVLFNKYMQLGAQTIAFNVDPLFNYCLDGLMILDVFNVDKNLLQTLAKDLNDEEILKRFNIQI